MIESRAQTDPKARQMFEGLQIVTGRVQSTSAAVAYLMLVLHQMGLGLSVDYRAIARKADIEKVLKLPPDMTGYSYPYRVFGRILQNDP